jgi:hypothetical protein
MENELKIPQVGEYVRNVGKLVKIEDVIPVPSPSSKDNKDNKSNKNETN